MNGHKQRAGIWIVVATLATLIIGFAASWYVLLEAGSFNTAIAPGPPSLPVPAAQQTSQPRTLQQGTPQPRPANGAPEAPPTPQSQANNTSVTQTGTGPGPSSPPSPQQGGAPGATSTTSRNGSGQSSRLLASGIPVKLTIPELNVDAAIESVGVVNGAMDVPSNVWDVAWLDTGPRPGETGNAVIDGHLDSTTGPAVFLWLHNLQIGNDIYVTDNTGKQRTFVVTGMQSYDVNDAPLERIFGPSAQANLNLITCSGIWDLQHHMYNERLVVYTQLVTTS